MDFNVDRLRAFIVVSRTGNLSAAARELGATQPNLGRQMTALEKEVRLTLFERHSRGLYLTKEGKEFLELCSDIVGRLAQGVNIIREKDSKPQGDLNIVAGTNTSEKIIKKLPTFLKEFPNIKCNFLSIINIYQFKIEGSCVGVIPALPPDPDLVQYHLYDYCYRIYASPRYLEKYPMPSNLEDLKSHRVVVYKEGGSEISNSVNIHIPNEYQEDQYSYPFIETNNGSLLRSSLINGLGIGPLGYDKDIIENNLLVDVFPEMPDHKVSYCFTHHKRLEGLPKIKKFHNFMKDVVKDWVRP